MITEHYMDPGSFHVPLRVDAPYDLLEDVVEFGHIVVTPQYFYPPAQISDANLLTAARYAGPVLETEWRDGGLSIRGQGMVWHLGDANGKGPIIETEVSFSAAALNTILHGTTGVLPAAVTQGTITTTGLNTYTGVFQWETPLSAIRTVMTDLDAHFRVNPNGTIDASGTTRDEVYTYTNPTVVVVRENWGSDPTYLGVPSRRLLTRRDAYEFASKLLMLDEQPDGTYTLTSSDTATHSYKDIHGNDLVRSASISKPATETVSLTNYMTNELNLRVVTDEQEVDTEQYEISGGLEVGEMFWIYDPPSGFVDTDNEIWFRGQPIWPKKTRLLEASWPIAKGMGVYYRPSGAAITSADWIDLTRFVDWEA